MEVQTQYVEKRRLDMDMLLLAIVLTSLAEAAGLVAFYRLTYNHPDCIDCGEDHRFTERISFRRARCSIHGDFAV